MLMCCTPTLNPHRLHWEIASILMSNYYYCHYTFNIQGGQLRPFNALLPCQAHELSLAQTHILASTAQWTIQATKIPSSHAQVHFLQNTPDPGIIHLASGVQVEAQCACE